jgi:hypothetical protein
MIERIIEWSIMFLLGLGVGIFYEWILENYEFRKKEAKNESL